jgi:SHS2 domain-containing protein
VAFRLLSHTADIGIEATGPSREAALEDAGLGLTSVLTGRDDVHGLGGGEEIGFALEAPDLESLAVAFLSELLWLAESQDLLWTGGGITLGTSHDGIQRLEARGNAVVYDPDRHGRGVEVKAITYHDLEFVPDRNGWRLRVLLDI